MGGAMPTEPSIDEIVREQTRIANEQKDQWKVMHETRERVAAAESGMESLNRELHAFRTESREDARELTKEIRGLNAMFRGPRSAGGREADNSSAPPSLAEIQRTVARHQGGLKIAGWITVALIPAIVMVLHYIGVFPL